MAQQYFADEKMKVGAVNTFIEYENFEGLLNFYVLRERAPPKLNTAHTTDFIETLLIKNKELEEFDADGIRVGLINLLFEIVQEARRTLW